MNLQEKIEHELMSFIIEFNDCDNKLTVINNLSYKLKNISIEDITLVLSESVEEQEYLKERISKEM